MKELEVFEKYNNIMTTKEAVSEGITKVNLRVLLENQILEKVSFGVYAVKGKYIDEFYIFQKKYTNAIFSHNTALFFHNMTERTPIRMDVTIYNGYNPYRFKDYINVFTVKKELLNLGVVEIESPQGLIVKAYNLERCVCDLIKDKDNLDLETVNKIIRSCVKSKDFDASIMFDYAKKLKVYDKVKQYMEAIIW